MLIPIAVPFVDARADALTWTLDAPEQDALCSSEVELDAVLPGARLDLRVLGASHQVLVRCGCSQVLLSEVVACLPGPPGGLPDRHERRVGPVRYAFSSSVRRTDPVVTAQVVDDLLERLAAVPGALVGVFPGRRHAVTAVETTHGRDGAEVALGWTTWHSYPEAGEVVRTTSALRLRPGDGAVAGPGAACTVCDGNAEATTRGAP